MIIDSPIISGSQLSSGPLTQVGNVQITGSLTVSGSINGATISGSVATASYAENAGLLGNLNSGSFVATSSFNAFSGSTAGRINNLEQFSASLDATFATDASVSASILVLSQSVQNSEAALSSSFATTSGSIAGRVTLIEGNYVTTGSNQFNGSQSVSGSVVVSQSISVPVVNTPRVQNGSQYLAQDTNTQITAIQNGSQTWGFYPGGQFYPAGPIAGSSYGSNELILTDITPAKLKGTLYGAEIIVSNDQTGKYVWSFDATTGNLTAPTASSFIGTASVAISAPYYVTTASYSTDSSSLSGRVTIIEGQDATTGSNTFTGPQFISQASNAISFTSTASLYTDGGLRVSKDSFVSGTAYFNNITVYGTSSIQYITSSQVNIGSNIITVNTDTPAVRFGGLSVFDSGSTQLTGSLFWDSEKNHWIYSNPSGSDYNSAMLMNGPRNTGSLGSEQGTLANYIMKGQGGDHITSSQIFDDGTTVRIPGNLQVTGSFSGSAAIFANSVTAGGGRVIIQGTNQNAVWLNQNAGGTSTGFLVGRSYTSSDTQDFFIYDVAAGSRRLEIASTGAAIFSSSVTAAGAITAAGATFNGNTTISVNQNSLTRLVISNTTAGSSAYVETSFTPDSSAGASAVGKFGSSTTPYKITTASNTYLYNSSVAGDIAILNDFSSGAIKMAAGGSSTSHFTIASTGAATFSGSVTAGDLISTSYGIGRIQVTSTTNSANSGFRLSAKDSGGTTKNAGLYYVAGTTTATTFLSLAADDNNYQLSVLANGNVGIGTSSPVTNLEVSGSIGATGLRYSSSPAKQGVYLGNSAAVPGTTDYATIEMCGGATGGCEIDFTKPGFDFRGRIEYDISTDYMWFVTSATEKMRITSGGLLQLSSTNSTGIRFAGGSSNLNYYEEGSWTPALQNATVSYDYRSGTYVRIGNWVFVRWGFRISSISGQAGTVTIAGLPFTSVNWGAYQEPNISVSTGILVTADYAQRARVYKGGGDTSLYGRIANNGDTSWETDQLQNGSWIIGEIYYNV